MCVGDSKIKRVSGEIVSNWEGHARYTERPHQRVLHQWKFGADPAVLTKKDNLSQTELSQ